MIFFPDDLVGGTILDRRHAKAPGEFCLQFYTDSVVYGLYLRGL